MTEAAAAHSRGRESLLLLLVMGRGTANVAGQQVIMGWGGGGGRREGGKAEKTATPPTSVARKISRQQGNPSPPNPTMAPIVKQTMGAAGTVDTTSKAVVISGPPASPASGTALATLPLVLSTAFADTVTGHTSPVHVSTPSLLTVTAATLGGSTAAPAAPDFEVAVLTADALISFKSLQTHTQSVYDAYGVAYVSAPYVAGSASLSVILPVGQYYISAVVGGIVTNVTCRLGLQYTLTPVSGVLSSQSLPGLSGAALYTSAV